MLPQEDSELAKMNVNPESVLMSRRQPFLSALDYIFYIDLHIEKERLECYDQRFTSLQAYDTELPKLCDILQKLVHDLQSSSDLFLSEFVENDGIYCLLNLLRQCLNRQQSPGTDTTDGTDFANSKQRSIRNKERHHYLKRALNDEYDCLVCLNIAVKRNPKAIEKMVSHKTGLSTLTSCIVSNLIKSRLIALQLLTKVCDQPFGTNRVLEAMSTMRIIFGESVRFKFLVSMLNSSHNCSPNGIECNALFLLNAILSKTTNCAEKIRLQCELREAGLDIDYLQNRLIKKNIPKSEVIWREIQTFRNQYINLNEKKKLNSGGKDELKEEVHILQKALNKLEADKISLMTIERELKEKCEDLEQEVDHLKNKFNVLIPVDKKVSQRPGSDNGTGDSGQWSDCDIEANKSRNKQKLVDKDWKKSIYNDCDQNMKNEEEFIYVPAIHPPKDFAQYVKREQQMNYFKESHFDKYGLDNTSRKPIHNNKHHERSDEETRWRQRQRNTGREMREEMSNIKPHVVDVLPKYKFAKTADKYTESSIGTDRENSELILDWNYAKLDRNGGKENEDYETNRPLSRSMNFINHISGNHFDDRNSFCVSNTQTNINNNFSLNTQFKPINSSLKQDLSQSNGSLSSSHSKKKGIRSSLQSYFFTGNSTLKNTNKTNFNSIQNMDDSLKSFPFPKTYRKNFIVKGHGNCGLYSGFDHKNNETLSKNMCDDHKNASNSSVNALIHKEITEAARDVGAWL